jgi:hypothetical protein
MGPSSLLALLENDASIWIDWLLFWSGLTGSIYFGAFTYLMGLNIIFFLFFLNF